MRRPFFIVPWSEDFLAELKSIIAETSRGRPGRCVVVFPHSRPRRYLTDYYRREGKAPLLLPRMMTGQELIAHCRSAWLQGESPRQASRLDQIALLKRSVERVGLLSYSDEQGDMGHFFPWGLRLAGLMEECFGQLSNLRDLPAMDGQVEPFAASLLEKLGKIRDAYLEELARARLSTPGLDAALVAHSADQQAPLPDFLQERMLILAGFVRLTRAENSLFRYLWGQGALVALHTDPGLAQGRSHWSTQDHAQWMRQWGADCVLRNHGAASAEQGKQTGPKLHFFAGYDLHSQLAELQTLLSAHNSAHSMGDALSQAVVLPHSDLLMPTLHHLPQKDVNISLGYPLARSLLARLIESVFQVRESLREGVHKSLPEGGYADGRVYWRSLLNLISHPYVRMLRREEEEGRPGASLRPLLRLLEHRLRTGPRLVNPHYALSSLLDELLGDLDGDSPLRGRGIAPGEEDAALLEHCFSVLIQEWAEVSTLRQTARALGSLCALLLRYGGKIWKLFPIDAECLMRLMHNLIPGLEDNGLADEPLPVHTLLAIVRHTLAEERVPFEADPLTGLQLLGMLETRLLRFDRVYLLDLTEDRLPGAPRQDPLLPDSLRALLELPDTHERDRLAAHTFQRLLAGAREVWMLWQEGVEQSGLLDAKKERSRFVEEALWQEEKARGVRLGVGKNSPLRSAVFPLAALPLRQRRVIVRSPEINASMEALLSRPLSPTLLDAYLRCPARFFYEHVCRIHLLDEVKESDDPQGVGIVLHETLRRAYLPYLGERLGSARPSVEELETIFGEVLRTSDLEQRLPAESWLMFRESGPLRLRQYREKQPEESVLLQVEQERRAQIQVGEVERTLYGVLDRVDRREQGEVILDYKSGRLPRMHPEVWEDDALWTGLTVWDPRNTEAENKGDTLFELRERIPNLQLACYLWLYHQESGALPVNAAWIPLAGGGEETWLFPQDTNAAQARVLLTERIPVLLRFVLRHMAQSPDFKPCEGEHCKYCPYQGSC